MGFFDMLFGGKAKEKFAIKRYAAGEIYVHTDKGVYECGDTIYGTVYVWAQEPLPAKSLEVKIAGSEAVDYEYEYTDGVGDDRETCRDRSKEKRKVIKEKIQLLGEGQFPQGQWAYNWQFRLPREIPGSFYWWGPRFGGGKNLAMIKYTVTVTLNVPGAEDLKCKQPLMLYSAPLRSPHAPTYEQKHTVRTLCCIPRGDIHGSFDLDRSHYSHGNVIHSVLQLHNGSSVTVDRVQVKLERDTQLRVSRPVRSSDRLVVRHVINENQVEGVKAGETCKREVTVPLTFKGYDVTPSARGSLIKCQYRVRGVVDIPWAPDMHFDDPTEIIVAENPCWSEFEPPRWATTAQLIQAAGPSAVSPEEARRVFGAHGVAMGQRSGGGGERGVGGVGGGGYGGSSALGVDRGSPLGVGGYGGPPLVGVGADNSVVAVDSV